MLTPAECHAKRNEFNAQAREAESNGRPDLGNWCRLMATNMLLMASDDPAKRARGQSAYENNVRRFEVFAEVMKSRAALRSVG
jgi:hypothetical protein